MILPVFAVVGGFLAVLAAALLIPAQALVIPVVVAGVMSGPAWVGLRRGVPAVVERLDRIEGKVDGGLVWQAAHDERHRHLEWFDPE